MKKLFVLVAVFTTVLLSSANAQQGNGNFDPAAMKARYFENTKPQLVEKAKITAEQADKVLEITWANMQKRRGFRDLAEDERKKQMDALTADQNKAFKEIPLTDDQVKAVNDYLEEQRRLRQQNRPNGGGGN